MLKKVSKAPKQSVYVFNIKGKCDKNECTFFSQGEMGSPGSPGYPGEKGNAVRLIITMKHLLMHRAADLLPVILGNLWKTRSPRRDSKIHPQPYWS